LRDIDLLGVVGFDDSPFVVVYLETMARLRGVVDLKSIVSSLAAKRTFCPRCWKPNANWNGPTRQASTSFC